MLDKVAPCFVVLRGEEKCFQSCSLASESVEQVKTTSHCGIENCRDGSIEDVNRSLACILPNLHLQETGGIDFLQLPDPSKASFRIPSAFLAIHSA
jgi:hypothetical protein